MSNIKSDMFNKMKDISSFYMETPPDNKLVETPVKEEPKVSLSNIKEFLDDFSKGFTPEQKRAYTYMSLLAHMSRNPNDSLHFFYILQTSFLASLKTTFPEQNFDDIEKSLTDIGFSLEKRLKDGNLQNTIYIHCMMGVLRGLL